MKYTFKTLCGCSQVVDIDLQWSPEGEATQYWKLPLIDPDESEKVLRMTDKEALKATITTRLFKRVGQFTFREVADQ